MSARRRAVRAGRSASARATATRCCCPIEISAGHRARASPSSAEPLEQRRRSPRPADETRRQPDVLGNRQLGDEPEALRHVTSAAHARPAGSSMRPASGRCQPPSSIRSVDLPDPERPTTTPSSPACSSSDDVVERHASSRSSSTGARRAARACRRSPARAAQGARRRRRVGRARARPRDRRSRAPSGSCVATTTSCREPAASVSASSSASALSWSSSAVGSSTTTIGVLRASATASDARASSPPESCDGASLPAVRDPEPLEPPRRVVGKVLGDASGAGRGCRPRAERRTTPRVRRKPRMAAGAGGRQIDAVRDHAPACRRLEPREQPQQRRLTAAGDTDERGHGARGISASTSCRASTTPASHGIPLADVLDEQHRAQATRSASPTSPRLANRPGNGAGNRGHEHEQRKRRGEQRPRHDEVCRRRVLRQRIDVRDERRGADERRCGPRERGEPDECGGLHRDRQRLQALAEAHPAQERRRSRAGRGTARRGRGTALPARRAPRRARRRG